MEGQTISFALVDGVAVLVHADVKLDATEWSRYVEFMREHAHETENVLVLAAGSGPDPVQREALAEAFMREYKGKAAVVTSNRVLRGVITIMGWLNRRVKPFDDVGAALGYLQLDNKRAASVLDATEHMRARLERLQTAKATG